MKDRIQRMRGLVKVCRDMRAEMEEALFEINLQQSESYKMQKEDLEWVLSLIDDFFSDVLEKNQEKATEKEQSHTGE